jgi:hypothetical protein
MDCAEPCSLPYLRGPAKRHVKERQSEPAALEMLFSTTVRIRGYRLSSKNGSIVVFAALTANTDSISATALWRRRARVLPKRVTETRCASNSTRHPLGFATERTDDVLQRLPGVLGRLQGRHDADSNNRGII